MSSHLPEQAADDPWTEILAAWAGSLALIWLAWRFLPESAAPFATVAAFAGIPVALHLWNGRSLAAEGLDWKAPLRSIGLVAACSAVFLPLYAAGFFAIFGTEGWRLPSPEIPLVAFVGNLFFAALPEEIFFRGHVQPRLAALYGPPARRFAGLPVGRAVVLAAALFALTHVAWLPSPFSLAALERLTTFFPGLLFGALRERSGDVATPALFHAACNAWLYTLQQGYAP